MQQISHDKPCSDHLGNIFGNIKSMCAYWHIRPETFTRRINVYKMTVEEALTKPVKHNSGLICYDDHLGNKFYSRTSMCEHWGVARKLFEYRIAHGWALEDALTKPTRQSKKPGLSL